MFSGSNFSVVLMTMLSYIFSNRKYKMAANKRNSVSVTDSFHGQYVAAFFVYIPFLHKALFQVSAAKPEFIVTCIAFEFN